MMTLNQRIKRRSYNQRKAAYYYKRQRQLDMKDTKSKGNIPRFTQIPDAIAKEISMHLETFAQFACPHDQSHFTNISQLTENR